MLYNTQARMFASKPSADMSLADAPDMLKIDYTEEFDQGLTDE